MIKRIAITGVESTGKSTLARQLAEHYHSCWVPEYVREYLAAIQRPYQESDLGLIARGQLELENEKVREAQKFLFCDTDLLVTYIWSVVKYGRCDAWIEKQLEQHRYHLTLLPDIDLPWEYDPLREHPHQRPALFQRYQSELKRRKIPYAVVSGHGPQRLLNAIKIIHHHFPEAAILQAE